MTKAGIDYSVITGYQIIQHDLQRSTGGDIELEQLRLPAQAVRQDGVITGGRQGDEAGIHRKIGEAHPTIWTAQIEVDSRSGDIDQMKSHLRVGDSTEIPLIHTVRRLDGPAHDLTKRQRHHVGGRLPNGDHVVARAAWGSG